LALVSLAIGFVLVLGFADRATSGHGAPGSATRDLGESETDEPTLDAADRQMARSILDGDATVQALLAGKQFEERMLGPWDTGGPAPELIGAWFMLRLAQPASYESTTWPTVDFVEPEEGTTRGYRPTSDLRASATNVTDLIIHIDFATASVKSVQPWGLHMRANGDGYVHPHEGMAH